ncbi:hypothetical protein VOI54_14025 [Tamlana sp. 2201CG12-4]|uniref:hypothetical protein n=1 Tax=Tamlana sp. 2201CG12-4 TaxID=3112582 RepID=UPI002DB9F5D0|nr:hypothetical protein [Tamlana sp. 2201CG12-4]MEC3908144.1 hypothetical protein [Tamlana sp. 2201CG12-4]
MKHFNYILLFVCISVVHSLNAQDYIEFNDRKNTVHGVYMGLAFHYGKISKKETFSSSFKIAYVANQQFEVGFVGVGFYSDLNDQGFGFNDKDLGGGYGGLHLEPIFFSKSKINLSVPVLIGGGAVGLVRGDIDSGEWEDDDWQPVFVFEPGINALYNISRYIQFEAGFKYRFSSRINIQPDYNLTRINGFSIGLGIKVGVFNMGRNRYKKHLKNEESKE